MPNVGQDRGFSSAFTKAAAFVIPNPWDIGTRASSGDLGFKALATTSSGFAWSPRPCRTIALTAIMCSRICAMIVDATDLPVNADFEGGFAHDPDGVAET